MDKKKLAQWIKCSFLNGYAFGITSAVAFYWALEKSKLIIFCLSIIVGIAFIQKLLYEQISIELSLEDKKKENVENEA